MALPNTPVASDSTLTEIDGGIKLDPTRTKVEVYSEAWATKLTGIKYCDKTWTKGDIESRAIADCANADETDRFYYGVDGDVAALAIFGHTATNGDGQDAYDANGYAAPENKKFVRK